MPSLPSARSLNGRVTSMFVVIAGRLALFVVRVAYLLCWVSVVFRWYVMEALQLTCGL